MTSDTNFSLIWLIEMFFYHHRLFGNFFVGRVKLVSSQRCALLHTLQTALIPADADSHFIRQCTGLLALLVVLMAARHAVRHATRHAAHYATLLSLLLLVVVLAFFLALLGALFVVDVTCKPRRCCGGGGGGARLVEQDDAGDGERQAQDTKPRHHNVDQIALLLSTRKLQFSAGLTAFV